MAAKFHVENQLVYKTDSLRLDQVWRSKMEAILQVWPLPAFHSFIEDGYITHLVQGTDLHGTLPFVLDPSCPPCILHGNLKFEILDIFYSAKHTGEKLGFTLGDITLGNILTDGHKLYLIDFDAIVSYPLLEPNLLVWESCLRAVFTL